MAERKERIEKIKLALLEFLGTNGRYYGELTRMEQSVEDLAQALYTRLDQLLLAHDGTLVEPETPNQRLASRFMATATKLARGGKVDNETADEFEISLDLLDTAAGLRREANNVQDAAETVAIKHKRERGRIS